MGVINKPSQLYAHKMLVNFRNENIPNSFVKTEDNDISQVAEKPIFGKLWNRVLEYFEIKDDLFKNMVKMDALVIKFSALEGSEKG